MAKENEKNNIKETATSQKDQTIKEIKSQTSKTTNKASSKNNNTIKKNVSKKKPQAKTTKSQKEKVIEPHHKNASKVTSIKINEQPQEEIPKQTPINIIDSHEELPRRRRIRTNEEYREKLSRPNPININEESHKELQRPTPIRIDEQHYEELPRRTPININEELHKDLPRRTPIRIDEQHHEKLSRRSPIRINEEPHKDLPRRTPIRIDEQYHGELSRRSPIKIDEQPYKEVHKPTPIKNVEPTLKDLPTPIKNIDTLPKKTIESIQKDEINHPQEKRTVYQTKKRKRLKIKNVILLLIFLISTTLLIYSGIYIYRWYQDSKQTQKMNDEIQDIVEIKDIEEDNTPTEQVEIVEQEEEIPKSNPYWDYIKMSLIDVNFNDLKAINNETVGWIQVNGTNINYPFVQASDNKFYLTHTFNKSYNTAGWVFMDYRNNIQDLNKNTILYAHGRLDRTMFGSLKNILQSNWYNNKDNYVIKLSTEYQNSLWQVFSVYHIPTTNDYIQTKFSSDEEFKEFVDMLQARSAYTFDTSVSGSDKILTLSTCYNDQEKVVMHAKLIKFTNR